MSRHLSVLSNLIIVLQVFLIVFCFVDVSILPPYVMFAGRFHPLILHLPISLIILLIPFSFYVQRRKEHTDLNSLFELVLHYIALIATLTALAGFLLAAGGGYEPAALQVHKWLGVSIAFVSHALLYLRKAFSSRLAFWNTSLLSTLLLTIAGSHYGGTLTHGEGFFAFNDKKENGVVIPAFTEKTTVFAGAVQPVLMAKCAYCHNDQKMKGGLNMKDIASMIKGGKNGAMWVSGDPEKSLMIQRMLLDLDDKNHMPPKGKTQLSSAEMHLFAEWIRAGANAKKTYHALAETDTLKKIIAKIIETAPTVKDEKVYAFEAASFSTIKKLNSPFRTIRQLSANSPALSVTFYLQEKFTLDLVKECKEIGSQIVELNLSGMPADDQIFPIISSFTNLEKLNLNATSITGKGLTELAELKKLEQLSVASTSIKADDLNSLMKLPSIKSIYIWNTKINETELASLKSKSKTIHWELGYIPNKSEMLQLSVPLPADKDKMILDNEEYIVLKNPMPNAKIRYTTDGTTPDSLTGQVFTNPIPATNLLRIKAITTALGWISSEVTDISFYRKGISVDSAKLLTEPSRGGPLGIKILIDLKKGLSQTGDQLYASWLGFVNNPLKAGFYFKKNTPINKVVISTADMTGSSSSGGNPFPPSKIIIKGGPDPKHLKQIGTASPEVPGARRPNASIPYIVSIEPGTYNYIEVAVHQLAKLPSWHPEKGLKAWVFVDEIFFY